MAALNSTRMPACSCSRQFPCAWTLSLGSSLLGFVVPILQVVLPQGLKPQPDWVPGDHRPLLSAGGAVPGLGQAQEYKHSPVANRLSCSPSPWPAGRPSSAGACHPALAGIPLASSSAQCTQHSAFGFLSVPACLSCPQVLFLEEAVFPLLIYSLPLGKVWDPWARLGIRL